jgi:hypothetical protein
MYFVVIGRAKSKSTPELDDVEKTKGQWGFTNVPMYSSIVVHPY